MRKILLTFFAALLCAASMWAAPAVAIKGKLPGAFTINSDGDQVWFSQGNLQATTSDLGEHWTWNFAENQWDFLGQTSPNDYLTGNGTVGENGSVDLFRWSSSKTYYGINTSTNAMDYVGDFVDWGTNAITNGGNQANIWRTPTKDEWEYLINTRTTTSGARYAVAKVNDKKGLILLPDDWNTSYYALSDINTAEDVACSSNTISSTDWTNILEAHGAVFLPGAGMRLGISSIGGVGDCFYMSSTSESSYHMGDLEFFEQFSVRVSSYSITNGLSVRLVSDEAPVPPTMEETPLTFEAMEAGAQIKFTGYNNPLTIQYSTDGTNWTNYTSAITLANVGDKVYLRGNNATYKYGNSYNGILGCTKDCYIYGNIMSLVDATNYATATTLTGANTFQKIFYNNTHIKNHPDKDLVLPATTLTNYCYHSMFDGCTGLTRVPQLPATNVAIYCYQNMFQGCTGLTSIPENLLPAETLQNYCYNNMFNGCTGLTSIPENLLPATTLANQCYGSMFYGCTGLTSVPENLLPATTLAGSCYSSMFYGCTGLTSVPANLLPATTLANYCYYCMFYGCTGLTTAPALPATTLATYCYYYMFRNCTNLTSAPVLPATTLAEYCYYNMFMSCSHLSKVVCYATESAQYATTKWLDGVSAGGTFYAPSDGCFNELARGTSAIPVGWNIQDIMNATPLTFEAMEAGATVTYTLQGTAPIQYSLNGGAWTDYDGAITLAAVGDKVSFRGNNASYNSDDAKFTCSADCYIYGNIMSLVNATNYATATTLEAESTFAYLFSGNAHIKNHATKDLVFPATTLADKCYKYMFYECTGLTSAPALPATTLAYDCYCYMFGDCSGLTSAPVLPATTLASRCYANMFSYCTGLTTAPALPATNLEYGCYSGMFSGCNGLTSAPVLPATTLAIGCYAAMFFGCASLTSAPELPATTLVDYCYVNMFCHCTNLSSVTCYATATASDATTNWLEEVAATGTFYGPKNSVFASEERGPNAIPVGWIFTPFQSSLTTAPTAITGLEYTGVAQALLNNDGVAEGGTLNYSLDNTNWSEAIPTATNAGDYTVYYKVVGDASHADFIPSPNEIAVSIAAPSAVALTANPDPDPQHAGVYYSTFYHSAVAYELSAGVEAYVAELSGDALIMTKIAEGGQVIPMDNAVILKANSGSITLTPSDLTPVTVTATNNLHGVDEPTAAPANCYVLSGHSTDNSVTGVGFYQYTGTLKAHKAYATISGGAAYAPKKLRFVFNQEQTTTDIEGIQPSGVRSQKVIENGVLYIIKNGVRYNAQGQVVK